MFLVKILQVYDLGNSYLEKKFTNLMNPLIKLKSLSNLSNVTSLFKLNMFKSNWNAKYKEQSLYFSLMLIGTEVNTIRLLPQSELYAFG